MLDRDVERAGFEEPLHQVVEVLGDQIVEVGLERDDAVGRGAVRCAPAPRAARWASARCGRSPAPCPIASIVSAGSDPNSSTTLRRIAAPVGVTVSQCTWAGTVGMPRSSSSVAGAGSGRRPCAVSTLPSPERHRRGRHARDPEAIQADRRAGHVDDRVDGAHLVEVDARERDAVDGGLGAAERLEDRERPLAHRRAQPRALEHPPHLAVGATVRSVVVERGRSWR